jgi:hypothetical protein
MQTITFPDDLYPPEPKRILVIFVLDQTEALNIQPLKMAKGGRRS